MTGNSARWPDFSTGWPEWSKSAPVRAVQITGPDDLPDVDRVGTGHGGFARDGQPVDGPDWWVQTLEGRMAASWGDYLAVGPHGDTWVVAREIFESSYRMGRGEESLDDLLPAIYAWCERHGIPRDPHAQLLKVLEELGELTAAVLKGNDEDLVGELGDVYVTLVATARALEDRTGGADLADCALAAYDRIKDRSGEVRNGVLVKASDLESGR